MAWGLPGLPTQQGAQQSSTSGNVLSIVAPNTTIPSGDVAFIFVACDNTVSGDSETSLVTSLSDTVGNTFSKVAEFTNGQAAAAAGATVSVWRSTLTTAISNTNDVVTVNFASNITAKAGVLAGFSKGAGNTVSVRTYVTNATDGASTATMTISGLQSAEYLWLHAIAHEGPSTDSIAGSANYTSITGNNFNWMVGTQGGGAAGNMALAVEARVNTATTDIVKINVAAADHAQLFIAVREKSSNALAGSVALVFGAGSSTVKGAGALAGTAAETFGAGSSTLKGAGVLAGSAAMAFGGTGAGVANMAASGTAALAFGAGASVLRGTGALAGSAAQVFGAGASAMTGTGVLAGTGALVFGAGASTAKGAGVLAGSAALAFAAGSSTATGAGALAGTAAEAFGGSGALQGDAGSALIGTAAMSFGAGASTMTGAGVLAGSGALAFGQAAVLGGDAPISAASALAFGGTAILLGDFGLAAIAAMVFGASASLTGTGAPAVEEATRPRPDDGGPAARRRRIIKPTGLVDRPRKEGRKDVADRIAESAELHAEVVRETARAFAETGEASLLPPIASMSLAEIEAEIGERLRAQLAAQDETFLLLVAMTL